MGLDVYLANYFGAGCRGGATVLGIADQLANSKLEWQIFKLYSQKPHLWPQSDPFTDLVYSAQPSDVAHVWVGGQHKVKDGHLVGWDLEALQHGSKRAITDLIERLARP